MEENIDNQANIHEIQPTKTSTSKWQIDVKRILLVLFVVVLFGGLFAFIGYFYGKFSSPEEKKTQNYQPSQRVLPSTNPVVTTYSKAMIPTKTSVSTNTYTSTILGVSFNYQNLVGPYIISPYEIGSKIYFGVGTATNHQQNPTEDQYIEVLQKNSSDDLGTALKTQILANYPSPECKINFPGIGGAVSGFSDNFSVAQINLNPPLDAQGNVKFSSDNCPPIYTATNFISYFVMDKNHPDKFLFFNVGQQPIGGGDDSIIQKSLKILN